MSIAIPLIASTDIARADATNWLSPLTLARICQVLQPHNGQAAFLFFLTSPLLLLYDYHTVEWLLQPYPIRLFYPW
tara:strand:- start:8554 stop:8781 length:228 start_codon:yes stop_codon:yes gene_type:complete